MWKGARWTPVGLFLQARGGSDTFVGYGKETDLQNLLVAFSSRLIFGVQLSPEGAVYSEERHEEAITYAEVNGLPQFEHLLFPRTGALAAALQAQRGKTTAIFDWTIAYKQEQAQGRLDW